MSEKLAGHVSRAGLACLKSMLDAHGVLTYACLGALSEDELHELCGRVRAAGFGLGHARALRELCSQARAEEKLRKPVDRSDEAPVLPSSLSPMLYFRLARTGLRQLEPILAKSGVQSVGCFGKLSEDEQNELAGAIAAAGLNPERAMSAIRHGGMPAVPEQGNATTSSLSGSVLGEQTGSMLADKEQRTSLDLLQAKTEIASTVVTAEDRVADDQAAPTSGRTTGDSSERPAKRAKLEEEVPIAGHGLELAHAAEPPCTTSVKEESLQDGCRTPKGKIKKEFDDPMSPVPPHWDVDGGPFKLRLPRDAIDDVVRHLRVAPAEIVRYRDKTTGHLQDARVPKALLSLLNLRASCAEKYMSEEKIARLAMDVMEAHGYDPVKAFFSLSPAAVLCPASAVRVLGVGEHGTVFMEEKTGHVVKIMLDDFAEQEYQIFCAFADVGLAARPIGLHGPKQVPGGALYSVHMEKISHTLYGVLHKYVPRGPRHGLNPPSEDNARRIGEAIVRALQKAWDNGLVHGDLHLENIALQDPDVHPVAQFLDFGRSARSTTASQSASADALRAGHEQDVFRLLEEMCNDYDYLKEQTQKDVKACEKEASDLRKHSSKAGVLSSWATKSPGPLNWLSQTDDKSKDKSAYEFVSQLHDARQILGLQAHIEEEPKALVQAEAAYNAILEAVVRYACKKLDLTFDGVTHLSNKRLRQAVSKRRRLSLNGYFKSDLFFAGPQ
eukprot:gnl/TRDRNA2_/TRDRNA2_29921_c0_seq1.p1 gnl/TRDRNA2_/TRDRNA2_29921_c0~~gnl/TRDRNA2_/TRDRNA2_29921_c0_seq1.p1  ORF type:complete len:743 (+),score=137.28 gnl/TRDRNA2_/TRDRNA2_29921_c0_seq1:57-2231(+)